MLNNLKCCVNAFIIYFKKVFKFPAILMLSDYCQINIIINRTLQCDQINKLIYSISAKFKLLPKHLYERVLNLLFLSYSKL